MSTNSRERRIKDIRHYVPNFDDRFDKPIKSGKKPCDRIRKRKGEPDIVTDRFSKEPKVNVTVDPFGKPEIYTGGA